VRDANGRAVNAGGVRVAEEVCEDFLTHEAGQAREQDPGGDQRRESPTRTARQRSGFGIHLRHGAITYPDSCPSPPPSALPAPVRPASPRPSSSPAPAAAWRCTRQNATSACASSATCRSSKEHRKRRPCLIFSTASASSATSIFAARTGRRFT